MVDEGKDWLRERVIETYLDIPEEYRQPVRMAAREAVDQIKKHGWVQGTYRSRDGFICAVQGMMNAREEDAFVMNIPRANEAYMALHVFETWVPRFNDHPQTTEEDVLLLLKTIGWGDV